MPKYFTKEEKDMIASLHRNGLTHKEIASKMASFYPGRWEKKLAFKSVAKILKEYTGESLIETSKTLDEMSRDERFHFVQNRLKHTSRFKMTFSNFSEQEKEVFIDEYLKILKSTDTLTEAEEQQLFATVLELVLALQSLSRKEREEQFVDQSLKGLIPQNDPRYRIVVNDSYQKEYDQHMKLYQKGFEQLKMSRKDRLKEVRSERMTLVELAENLSSKTTQADAASEIERLSKMRDEELKRLLESKYLHGIFED